jgi:hypothetical protein
MSDEEASPASSGISLKSLIVPLATLLVGLALGYVVVAQNKDATISIDASGVKFDVASDAKFSDVLDTSLAADDRSVEAILESRGFYRPASEQLIAVLAAIDASTPGGRKVADGLLQMLWNLEGPFESPGTLSGADGRMVEALNEIARGGNESGEANKLLAALWEDQIDQTGIFRQRKFSATVEGGPSARERANAEVYACPGSAIVDGRVIMIFVKGGRDQLVTEVRHDPAIFSCSDDDPVTTRQLLAGRSARLAMNGAAFRRVWGEGADPPAAPATVDFVVFPRNLAPNRTREKGR